MVGGSLLGTNLPRMIKRALMLGSSSLATVDLPLRMVPCWISSKVYWYWRVLPSRVSENEPTHLPLKLTGFWSAAGVEGESASAAATSAPPAAVSWEFVGVGFGLGRGVA